MRPLFLVRMAVLALAEVAVRAAWPVCRVPQPGIVCAEYSNSKTVVIATLRASRYAEADANTDGYLYSVTVRTLLRVSRCAPQFFFQPLGEEDLKQGLIGHVPPVSQNF